MIVTTLSCPNCGGNITIEQKQCEYCNSEIYISKEKIRSKFNLLDLDKRLRSYNSLLAYDNTNNVARFSIGVCRIQQMMYDEAVNCFKKCLENSIADYEAMFYLAISMMSGKKPFLILRKDIDKIENLLFNAISIEPKAIYYYLLGYIRYDHHERKGYVMKEKSVDFFKKSKIAKISYDEIENLHDLLNTSIPSAIKDYFI